MKRGTIIGIGTVLLVVGVAGLGLLQSRIILPPAKLQQPQSSPGQTLQAPEPQPEEGPSAEIGRKTGAAETVPGPGSGEKAIEAGEASERGEQPKGPGGVATERQGPAPPVGQDETGASKEKQTAQSRPPADSEAKRKEGPGKSSNPPGTRGAESRRYGKSVVTGSRKPLVIRFKFDPAHKRRIDVALVHFGDKIRVKINRIGKVNRRVYFTFYRDVDSPQGAVLELATRYPFDRRIYNRPPRGYYLIEVKIYRGNRWNIMPRSFV